MKVPKRISKAIENSKLMYELISQEKYYDLKYKYLNFEFPPSISEEILKFWSLHGDTTFLINELNAIDKCSSIKSFEEFKNNNRYFLTALILHDKIVNKEKLQLC